MRRFKRSGPQGEKAEHLRTLGAALVVAALGAAATLWVSPRATHRRSSPPPTNSARAPSSDAERALAAWKGGEAMAVVQALCTEACSGRKAGTPGADRAAGWLAGQLRRIGLEPARDAPDFRHRFTMPVSLLDSRWDRKAKLVGPGGVSTLIEYPCFRGSGFSAEGEAILAGWGISRRDQGWDDFQGRDVRGKYVVYREGAPGPHLDREEHARWRDAKARGALGCLILSQRPDEEPTGLENPIRDFPVLRLDPATTRRLFQGPVPPPPARQPAVLAPLRIEIPRAEDPARPVANIIGMIRGTDPALADEAVILSAHYDHLGADSRQPAGEARVTRAAAPRHQVRTAGNARPATIYPGADDDASGVAVVLGAARALRALGERPRRTLLFCLWTGEECGLLGARAYVEHPLLPLSKTRFVLQVEMVGAGRSDSFLTSPARLAGTGHDAIQAAAARLGLSLAGDTCKGVSDHMAFIRRGVPGLVITTAGEHPDYHTPRDTPDRIRAAGIENATRLCALAVWHEANF